MATGNICTGGAEGMGVQRGGFILKAVRVSHVWGVSAERMCCDWG